MRKKIIHYYTVGSSCGLTTDSRNALSREHGWSNLGHYRPATQEDLDWVLGMGGQIPEGKLWAPPKPAANKETQ